ncbi:Lipid phosphate phosphatase epsilon 2-chloroplastic [Striga hermonthica]|uniref:Lipid phosphate phosphatase epsilon 2-chloroplastic n=1 Tax=Striga hermonthica TaxID=68872 RepID=A0A9N7NXN2_STRHE|nr:Lipid phosphate phosphatase epsilon 2-chloroplastic [Striga hermonthica]
MSALSVTPATVAAFSLSQSRKLHKSSKNSPKRLDSRLEFEKPSKIFAQKLGFRVDFLKPSKNFAQRLDYRVDFNCRDSVSCARRTKTQNIMIYGVNGVRASTNDESIEVFEQEAFVDGSLNLGAGRLEATLNSLSKWLVSALFAVIVLWRHDPEVLWAAMGAVLNAQLSVVLKKLLNQERPISTLRSDPGMPSSHAQAIFYTVLFLNLAMVEWYGVNVLTATLGGFLFILGSYFSWLRVSQQLHTAMQVVVGAVIGSFFSIIWFLAWNTFVLDAFVSSLWVRVVVILGAVGSCVGFLLHVIRTWMVDER